MSFNLFSKLLRSFFHNPFHRLLNQPLKAKKSRRRVGKNMQVENLEPRLVPSVTAPENPNQQEVKQIVFVDSSIPNRESLFDATMLQNSTTEVVQLNALQNGLEQIANALAAKTNLEAIHVFSHGQQGKIVLGNTTVGTNEINSNLDYLSTIGKSFTADGDLLLYGCYVADGFVGQDFVNRLAEVTGADVPASDDATGDIVTGGNWNLEQTTGSVESAPLVGNIGNNLLNNYTISIGQNSPKLYYQARSVTASPISRFSTNYYGNEIYVGSNPGPYFVNSYTSDNFETYYREVWRDQTIYYPFQGNRTVKVRLNEAYSANVGNGVRFGTQTFTVNNPSNYQIWTTLVDGSIYSNHLGEARQVTNSDNFYNVNCHRFCPQ